jgi:hypothetical protein
MVRNLCRAISLSLGDCPNDVDAKVYLAVCITTPAETLGHGRTGSTAGATSYVLFAAR